MYSFNSSANIIIIKVYSSALCILGMRVVFSGGTYSTRSVFGIDLTVFYHDAFHHVLHKVNIQVDSQDERNDTDL